MPERKEDKLRKCVICEKEILTTAKGIKRHASECKG